MLTDAVAGTGGAWTLAYTALAMLVRRRSRAVSSPTASCCRAYSSGSAVLVRSALFWVVMAAEGYPRGFGAVHLHAALEAGALTAAYAFVYLLFRSRFGGESTRIERYA